MLPESEWKTVARLKAEPFDMKNRRAHRPNLSIIKNISIMLEDSERWDREIEDQLVFRHDTGVLVQLRRLPPDDNFKPNAISQHILVWMEGMPPFQTNVAMDAFNPASKLMADILLREARVTIDRVGVLAALCAP